MRVPDDVICEVCKKFFCCSKCRHKHEVKNHAIIVRKPAIMPKVVDADLYIGEMTTTTIYLFCPICKEKPLPLQKEIYTELLDHIEEKHLPLNCQKCFKMYTKIEDLKEFSKCIQPRDVCQPQKGSLSAGADVPQDEDTKFKEITTIATQTSPMRALNDNNDTHITPISMINLRWKAKSKIALEEFISDSVSIKNISSISNSSIRRSIGITSTTKGKVVRTTSTPLHAEMLFAKPKEQIFNASAAHVSSIYNSGFDSESSLPVTNHRGTPSKQSLDVNRYRKVGARAKMSAVTPLRQVMSKSIQKAFVEHGFTGNVRGHNRKKIFDSIDNSSPQEIQIANTPAKIGSSPLDLRLSPAMRRFNSVPTDHRNNAEVAGDFGRLPKGNNLLQGVLMSSKKTTTESIVITRMQQLEAISSNDNISSTSSTSTTKPCSITTNSSGASSTSAPNSVYQTCRSVEIIHTSTELSNVHINNYNSNEDSVEEMVPAGHSTALNIACHILPPITPTTRIKGAVIKKTLIMFETPKVDVESKAKQQNLQPEDSPNDVFFTPDATPVRKLRVPRETNSDDDKPTAKEEGKQLLKPYYSPSRRPSLRCCTKTASFSRIEDVTEDFDDDDEVFVPEEEESVQEEDVKKPAAAASGRLWSLMTSVMRLPSLKGAQMTAKKNDSVSMFGETGSKSLIKRCASIAGSMVRSKPLIDDDQLQPLKRKRTYTTDHQSTYLSYTNSDLSSICDSSSSSKRFRIQGRKPIERMRINS